VKTGFKFCITVLLGLLPSLLNAQDAHFSQYYSSGLYLNPSLAGVEPGLMVGMNYRNQWRSIVVPYVTSQLSVIAPIYVGKGKKANHLGGVGLSFYNDKSGDGNFRTTGVNVNAAYNLNLSSKHTITFGVQGGFIQKSINFSDLQWGEQYNPYNGFDSSIPSSETTINRTRIYPDIGAGMIYSFGNTKKKKKKKTVNGYVGLAAYHINSANESLVKTIVSKLPILYKGHAGLVIPINHKLSFSPNVLYMTQNNVNQLNTGLYLNYEINKGGDLIAPSMIILGGWYRLKDSFIASVGFGNNNYLFGFSYDVNNSSLRYSTQGRGAFEFSLSIRKFKVRDSMKRFHTPRI